jgi:hypothetical protein
MNPYISSRDIVHPQLLICRLVTTLTELPGSVYNFVNGLWTGFSWLRVRFNVAFLLER